MGMEKSIVNEAIRQAGLSETVRPEQLTMEQFVKVSEALKNMGKD